MNGEHQEIYEKIEELQDSIGEVQADAAQSREKLQDTINKVQVNGAKTRKDIKYLNKSMDDFFNRTSKDIADLQQKTNWNENKIYMGIGGIGLLALIISGLQYLI